MAVDISELERGILREIDAFSKPGKDAAKKVKTTTSRPRPSGVGREGVSYRTGFRVKLAVRTKQLELDTVFEHVSSSISKLEAQLEAEKAARKAGYPIIGYLIDIQRL